VAELSGDRSAVYQVDLSARSENDARIIAKNYVPNHSLVLDVGSACGDFGLLLQREKNCHVHGMEFSQASIEIAEKTLAYSRIHQVDLNSFDEDRFEQYTGYFDCIALLDVLEHVVDSSRALRGLKRFLKPDGFFVISLPNVAFGDIKLQLLADNFIYTETGILDETHVRFFTHRSIAEYFAEQGIEILDCSAKVEDIEWKSSGAPNRIKRYISSDPHSFVYQYVFTARPSILDQSALKGVNASRMRISWVEINPHLRVIRLRRLIDNIFPVGSTWRRAAIKIRNALHRSQAKD
jgi:2-polyprenyl-3-methyl-5-hydroxy-6-metoxy-1,4-benzoquinol methylase